MAEIEPASDEEIEAAAAFTAAPDGGFIFARKPSRIVIVSNGRPGVALWWVGAGAWSEIEESGLSDAGGLGPDDAPSGISIWEGNYRAVHGSDDYDVEPVGKFRAPTAEEWEAIGKGRCPWDPKDWHVAKDPSADFEMMDHRTDGGEP